MVKSRWSAPSNFADLAPDTIKELSGGNRLFPSRLLLFHSLKLVKARPWGDSVCEWVIEHKA
jgi:hypothetical protein